MTAKYPTDVYSPRTKENKPGEIYDEANKFVIFAEDIQGLDDEIVAIEEELGSEPKGVFSNVTERLEDIDIKIIEHTGEIETAKFEGEKPTLTKRLNSQLLPQPFTDFVSVLTISDNDVTYIEKPIVTYDAGQKKFYMFTICYNGSSYIAYRNEADSPNGPYNNNKQELSFGSDNWFIDTPVISAVVNNGGGNMEMWFSAHDGSGYGMGYAISDDYGLTWNCEPTYITAFGSNSWGSGLVNNGLKVYKLANCYVGLFSAEVDSYGLTKVKTAYSQDGKEWTISEIALTCGGSGSFDEIAINYFGIYFDSGTWYIVYAGYNGSTFDMGIATRTGIPFGSFEKIPWNPITSEGLYGFEVLKYNDKFYIYCNRIDSSEIVVKELSP